MEGMTSELNLSVTVFFWVTTFIILVGGIFIFKIFIRVSDLLETFNKFMVLINYEFEPTMKELQKTLKHLSSISDKADKHVCQLSDGIDKASVATGEAASKAKVSISSLIHGLTEGIKRFLN